MAASMNFCPGGAEYDDEDFDEDGFMFGCDDFDKVKTVSTSNFVPIVSTTDFSGRTGFGKPVPKPLSKQQERKVKRGTHNVQSVGIDDFRVAIMRNNLEGVKKFIREGFDTNSVLKCGWTPLMYAASNASPSIVQCLIQNKANVNSHKDMYTVLMAGCASTTSRKEEVLECVNLLVAKGANVNAYDRYHMSPLIYAAREGRSTVVASLLDCGANINKQDSRGWTSLSWAASKNHKDVVRLLIDRKANIKLKHCDGQTVEDIAVAADFQEIISMLKGKPVVENERTVKRVRDEMLGATSLSSSANIPLTNGRDVSNNSSIYEIQSSVVKYGEMELFLCGLDLSHLVTKFQEHHVDFATFLQTTDDDLIKMGIQQLGVRKKILDGIQAVHKKEWERTSLPSVQYNKQLSCVDAVAIVANISKHTKYISSTLAYICGQVNADQQILHPQDGVTTKDLLSHTKTTLNHVKELHIETARLDTLLTKVLSSRSLDQPDVVLHHNMKKTRVNFRRLLNVTLFMTVIGFVTYKRQHIHAWVVNMLDKT